MHISRAHAGAEVTWRPRSQSLLLSYSHFNKEKELEPSLRSGGLLLPRASLQVAAI